MKKIFSILVVLGVLATGCEDELTIFPEDSLSVPTFYKTEVDFEQAVNGAYAPLRTVLNGTGGGPSGIYLKEMHSDNTYYARNTAFGATEQQEDLADFAVPTDQGITTNVHVQNVYVYNCGNRN